MKTSINIGGVLDRFNFAFGQNAMKLASRFLQLPTYSEPQSDYADMLFENRLSGKQYNFGVGEVGGKIEFAVNDNFLAPPPIVDFSRDKYVLELDVDRSNHTVIEDYGNRAYNFTLRGLLIDANEHQFPIKQLKKAHEMFQADGTYKIVSDIFNCLEIYEVIFKKVKIGFIEGYIDTIKYNIQGVSIRAAEFIV